jgi:uncharacterized protein
MLVDTSGLLALLNRSQPFHKLAQRLYQNSTRRLVHSFILAEVVPLARTRGVQSAAIVRFLQEVLVDLDMEFVWVDESLTARAVTLLQQRLDKDYSLCDGVSFVLMRDEGITEALTTDRHFEQEGFQRLLV